MGDFDETWLLWWDLATSVGLGGTLVGLGGTFGDLVGLVDFGGTLVGLALVCRVAFKSLSGLSNKLTLQLCLLSCVASHEAFQKQKKLHHYANIDIQQVKFDAAASHRSLFPTPPKKSLHTHTDTH